MNLRSLLFLVTIGLVGILSIVGCASTPTPEPTVVVPTVAPTQPPPPTVAPTNTALPPTLTPAPPTNTPLPPTNTPIPSSPTPTVTNTSAPVTVAAPTITPTETAVPLKFAAPVLVSPTTGDLVIAGKDDIVFRWAPVGPLQGNECYLVTLRIINMVDNEPAESSFIAPETCNDSGQTDPLSFTVNRRGAAPQYQGLLDYATAKTPAGQFRAIWTVTAIQNNGADPNSPDPAQYIAISPPSAPFEFEIRE